MSNLPKYYYFQDIPAEGMAEIVSGMERALPEPAWEEIDQWLSCNNTRATIPAWYERGRIFRPALFSFCSECPERWLRWHRTLCGQLPHPP
jgi:hypothetical protein